VENLRTALADRIQKLEWMSDATKKEALKKLNAFGVKIGYPDKWRDYKGLNISRDSYYQNAVRASEFAFKREIDKVGKPVDRAEWGMTPPTVNAYYNPTMNEIVFPAGILQPPFFDAQADDAVNYGGIGAVIGHEMTHGFDDQGRQYNAEGNLKDWWTEDDAKKYTERADVIKEQFNNYVALDTLRVNGELTLGENIADLGGLTVAYHALQMAIAKAGNPGKIDGFTPEQRFFLSWAQVWRQNIRPENLKVRLITDPHSPGRFRAIGPLSNMNEFLSAFDVADEAPMARPVGMRAKIW
jgi:putative endopeptidase